MDGVSTAATIAMLVAVAVQSVQLVRKAIDGLKEARYFAKQVDSLHHTLLQNAGVAQRSREVPSSSGEDLLIGLRRVIQACIDDIQRNL